MNGNGGQGTQGKQGRFEGIKIRLGCPTTRASVNGMEVVDKEKDRGPGLGGKELKQIHTVVCSVSAANSAALLVAASRNIERQKGGHSKNQWQRNQPQR